MSNIIPIKAASERARDEPAELNLRVLTCLGRYLEERRGQETHMRVLREAGLEPGALDGKTRWVSVEKFERLLAAARAELSSDDELFEACLYKYAESYGLIRYLVMLVSPLSAYEKGAQMFDLASRVSTFQTKRMNQRSIRMVYRTKRPESRLMCVSRMSALAVTPTLWGLPRAHIEEKSCVARGGDCCEYHVGVYGSLRWLAPAVGLLIGVAAAAAIQLLPYSTLVGWVLLPIVGLLMGYLVELRSVHRFNVDMGVRAQELLREVARDDAEARRELIGLHGRQNEWARLMEEQLAERSAALDQVMERIKSFRASTQSTVRGLSHDIRNPLQVLAAEAELLRLYFRQAGVGTPEVLADHDRAVQKIEKLLAELMDFVTSERTAQKFFPASVNVASLTERLRRQIRALSHGKPIRTSAFTVREAPEVVMVDPMVLDRILDNLLTNAAKYTDDGSIVVEVGGTPGFLTVKVSDTGLGIEAQRLERIFDGRTSDVPRAPGSYGVGLSVVVDLLRQIGGRIEIMSKPAVGTTVWLHIPAAAPETHAVTQEQQVITIRRTSN